MTKKREQPKVWHNRIVGYEEVAPDSLLANELNFRVHPAFQQNALKGALDEIGWIQDIIVNRRTSERWGNDQGVETLIDGHLRVMLAMRHNQEYVPVKYVDLEPEEERLALLSLDPITALATHDAQKLDDLLREINTGDEALQQLFDDLAKEAGIVPIDGEAPKIGGAQREATCPDCGCKFLV